MFSDPYNNKNIPHAKSIGVLEVSSFKNFESGAEEGE